jgi:hypothetical protein
LDLSDMKTIAHLTNYEKFNKHKISQIVQFLKKNYICL